MAVIKSSRAAAAKPVAVAKAVKAPPLMVELPLEPTEVSNDLDDFRMLMHGEKKIGKTTLAAQQEGVFVLEFDPERRGLRMLQRHINSWPMAMAYLKALEEAAKKGKLPYVRVVIDGVDRWYRMCQAWVCTKLAISHPSEESWGKAWDLLRTTFTNAVDRFMALPCGVWFICHSNWKEVETRSGKIEKLIPTMPATAEEIVNSKVDAWFAYDYVNERRVLIVVGDDRTGAGHSIEGHFLTPAGDRVREIDMGTSPAEAWKNFLAAFHNQQTYTRIEDLDNRPVSATVPARRITIAKKR